MSQAHNFCFPIRTLANDRVKLVPFSPERHAKTFVEYIATRPDLYAHMPSGPYATTEEFVSQFLDKTSRQNIGWFTFAVIDKSRPGSAEDEEGELAGMMSFMDTTTVHLSTEIGCIVILPRYQRTHVTTNAVGLMLHFALDGPAVGGMGLRRVQWKTSSMNTPSIRTAARLGFQHEGVLRWHMTFRQGAEKHKVGNGRALPRDSPGGDYGRDTVILALCWDDWEAGMRDEIAKAMARTK